MISRLYFIVHAVIYTLMDKLVKFVAKCKNLWWYVKNFFLILHCNDRKKIYSLVYTHQQA